MFYISHRVNSSAQLRDLPTQYGVEVDLREQGDRLILQHDPFREGEEFTEYLRGYQHGLMILHVKSEAIESRVLDVVRQSNVPDYFFLGCSSTMTRKLISWGEHKIAVRLSEHEPIELALSLAGQIDWVWIDYSAKTPLTSENYQKLKQHFKLCAASPELQGRGYELIPAYAAQLSAFPVDAICTKRPDLWQIAASRRAA